jgi:PAS domain S-box-containing protein
MGEAMSWNDEAIKQRSLPVRPTPSASIAGRTMRDREGCLDARSKRSPAIYLTNPAPSKVARTRLGRLPNLPDDAPGERFPLASCLRRLADLKGMDCDFYQTRDNFRTIFNASPAMLCIIQLNGLRCREVNKAYEQRTGYSRSEVLGKNSLKLGLWNNAGDRRRMIDKLLTDGHIRGHQQAFQTKTSTPLITLVSAEVIAFGGELCALVVAEDVTVRRQAEQSRVDLSRRLINAQLEMNPQLQSLTRPTLVSGTVEVDYLAEKYVACSRRIAVINWLLFLTLVLFMSSPCCPEQILESAVRNLCFTRGRSA